MKHFIQICIVFLFAAVMTVTPQAVDSFDVLNIGAGGASASLAQTVAAESGGIEGVFYNPATLGSLNGGVALLGSYNPYIEGMSLWSGAAAFRIPGVMTLAASGYGIMFEPIPGDIKFDGDTGRLMQSGDYVFGVSAAFPIGTYAKLPFIFDIGVTGRYVMEKLDNITLSGAMADAGMVLAFTNLAGNDTLSMGAYGRNLGVNLTAGNDITLPMAVSAGVMYASQVSPEFGFKALADGTYFFNDTPKFNVGAEMGLFKLLFIRSGYMIGYGMRSFTVGGGLKLGLGGMNVSFDYSLVPLGDLGMHHAMQLTGVFGDSAKADPGAAMYAKGLALEKEKQYDDALALWAKVPEDSSAYESARKSMAKLSLYVESRRAFGEAVGHAREGRMREAIAAWGRVPKSSELYDKAQKNIAKAKAKLEEDAAAQPPAEKSDEDLFNEAMGLAREKKYKEAIEIWSKIKEGAELYEKAQKGIERAKKRMEEEAE